MPNINNKKIIAYCVSLFLFVILLLPLISDAAIITCDGSKEKPCDFNAFIDTVNRIINWFILVLAPLAFVISTVWGGYIYVTSQGDSGKIQKAKDILWSTVLGFIIILTAWLIIHTLLRILAPTSESVFKFIGN